MTDISRRRFFGSAAAAASLGIVPGTSLAATRDATGPPTSSSQRQRNRPWTPDFPSATAVAVKGSTSWLSVATTTYWV